MSEEGNVAVLKQAYRAWNENKEKAFEHWTNLIADDVQWRSIAEGAPEMKFTRCCTSKDDVLRYFRELASDWEMVHFTPSEFIAQGDRVVMLGQCAWKHRATGKVVETPKADIFRMKDSKIVEFYEFYDTALAYAGAKAE